VIRNPAHTNRFRGNRQKCSLNRVFVYYPT
jgi:hypothetical protein